MGNIAEGYIVVDCIVVDYMAEDCTVVGYIVVDYMDADYIAEGCTVADYIAMVCIVDTENKNAGGIGVGNKVPRKGGSRLGDLGGRGSKRDCSLYY